MACMTEDLALDIAMRAYIIAEIAASGGLPALSFCYYPELDVMQASWLWAEAGRISLQRITPDDAFEAAEAGLSIGGLRLLRTPNNLWFASRK